MEKNIHYKQKIEDAFYRVYSSMEKNSVLNSVKRGLMLVMPIFVVGAFTLVIMNFPIPGYNAALKALWGGWLFNLLFAIYDVTFGSASIYFVLAVSYTFSIWLFRKRHSSINLITAIVSLISYFAMVGWRIIDTENIAAFPDSMFAYLNVNNIFIALLTSLTAPALFHSLYSLTFNLNKKRFMGGDVDFSMAVKVIFPMAGTVAIYVTITALINLTGYNNLQDLFVAGITYPFKSLGTGLGSALLILFLQTAIWFFGVHGSNVFESTNNIVFIGASGGITKPFLDTFVLMGGCGSTICLLVALLVFARLKRNKVIARSATIPMLFNINEILVFGLPIVLNPVLLIPFILTPIVLLFTSYSAMMMGLVPVIAVSEFSWTTPVLFSGYMFSGNVAGLFLQLFNIILGVFIYMPFVRLNEKMQKRKFNASVSEMVTLLQTAEAESKSIEFFGLTNYLYASASEVAELLRRDIENGNINLYYQPLVDDKGDVVSAEALLRWGSDFGRFLYPPLVVSIANEDGTFDALTKRIITKALDDLIKLNEHRERKISFSVNVQIGQLVNSDFVEWVIAEVERHQLGENMFSLEITEESHVSEKFDLQGLFKRLSGHNIKVSLDDFSMGHTSISYLQQNLFSHVKLDGSITKKMMENERSRDIVKSIIDLGKTLDFDVIAEYVETEAQRDILKEMGCYIYQGWLYSPAIDFDHFVTFVESMEAEKTE